MLQSLLFAREKNRQMTNDKRVVFFGMQSKIKGESGKLLLERKQRMSLPLESAALTAHCSAFSIHFLCTRFILDDSRIDSASAYALRHTLSIQWLSPLPNLVSLPVAIQLHSSQGCHQQQQQQSPEILLLPCLSAVLSEGEREQICRLCGR